MRLSASDRESAVWEAARGQLDERGFALIPAVLSPEACDEIAGYYDDDRRFRSRVEMARYAFGRGEYKYFAYPLPRPFSSSGIRSIPSWPRSRINGPNGLAPMFITRNGFRISSSSAIALVKNGQHRYF